MKHTFLLGFLIFLVNYWIDLNYFPKSTSNWTKSFHAQGLVAENSVSCVFKSFRKSQQQTLSIIPRVDPETTSRTFNQQQRQSSIIFDEIPELIFLRNIIFELRNEGTVNSLGLFETTTLPKGLMETMRTAIQQRDKILRQRENYIGNQAHALFQLLLCFLRFNLKEWTPIFSDINVMTVQNNGKDYINMNWLIENTSRLLNFIFSFSGSSDDIYKLKTRLVNLIIGLPFEKAKIAGHLFSFVIMVRNVGNHRKMFACLSKFGPAFFGTYWNEEDTELMINLNYMIVGDLLSTIIILKKNYLVIFSTVFLEIFGRRL